MANNETQLFMKAVLDTSNISKGDIAKVQKILNSNPVLLSAKLDTKGLKKQLSKVSAELASEFKKVGITINEKELLSTFAKLQKEANNTANEISKIKYDIDVGKQSIQIADLSLQFKRLGLSTDEVSKKMTGVAHAYKMLQNASDSDLGNSFKEYTKEIDIASNALRQLQIEHSDKELNISMSQTGLSQINSEMQEIKDSTKDAEQIGNAFADSMKKQAAKIFNVSSLMKHGADILREMKTVVYDVDAAMTSLYQVTDETGAKYDSFLANANIKAQELGKNISSFIEQSAKWAKLGFDLDSASALAEISSIYTNIANLDSDDTAITNLASIMEAFHIEATDSVTIVDSLSRLGNEFTADTASLGEGLQSSAYALGLAGNDMNQALAMLAGGAEITKDASEMGNALEVLSLRIGGMKEELGKLGAEYENVGSVSEMQARILNQTQGVVDTFDDNGSLKATFEILKEISGVWNQISKTNQDALLETLSGNQYKDQISALMQSFQSGQVDMALNLSINSDGAAYAEQDKRMDSLAAKTQQFETAFQSLSQTVVSKDFLKGLVDAGTGFINILDGIISQFGVLLPLLGGTAIAAFVKNFGWFCNKNCLKIA